MTKMPFDFLPLPQGRQISKPRSVGLTMMMDNGTGPAMTRDNLEVVGPYVDYAKLSVGTARLYSEKILREKVAIYADHNIETFIGGQFVEYVFECYGLDMMPKLMGEVARHGIDAVEISDSCIEIGDEERLALVHCAIDEGPSVHGEVGSKMNKGDVKELVRQAYFYLDAGCDLIIFEAAELVEMGEADTDTIRAIKDGLPAAEP